MTVVHSHCTGRDTHDIHPGPPARESRPRFIVSRMGLPITDGTYSVTDGPDIEMHNGKPVYYRIGDPVHDSQSCFFFTNRMWVGATRDTMFAYRDYAGRNYRGPVGRRSYPTVLICDRADLDSPLQAKDWCVRDVIQIQYFPRPK